MDPETVARRYYAAIDDGDYGALAALLHPEFAHRRPDRTLQGREEFVRFMREDRPRTDTAHALECVYLPAEPADEVAVRGRLRTEAGEELFGFVDVFRIEEGAIAELRTYTDSHGER